MKRTIIKIDENRCNGCGDCINGCHEGALQLIEGKAVMVSDLYCDGLGACIGECPVGAITLEEREADAYNEAAVMERIVPKGEAIIVAHLKHLKDNNEIELLHQGLNYLEKHAIKINFEMKVSHTAESPLACACPSSIMQNTKPLAINNLKKQEPIVSCVSELSQFPVQLHLLNPSASFLQKSNLLLAADCTAFASGDFHSRFLRGKSLAIACPKLDSNIQSYIDKLSEIIDVSFIDTLTVLIMEVPCCGGLIKIAEEARQQATRHIPIKILILSVKGEIKKEEWI